MSRTQLEAVRQAEGLSVRRFCTLIQWPRASTYRQRVCQTGPRSGSQRCPAALRQRVLTLAGQHPIYGYRKIWALLGADRHQVSQSSVYRWLKEARLLKSPQYQREARQRARAARLKYLTPPQAPNELWQVDLTWVDLGASGMQYVTNVVDYASRFPLASRLSPTHTTDDVIRALQAAMEEARRLRGPLPERIVLVTDNGSQFTSRRFQRWIHREDLPFYHVRGRSHHPQTIGMVERYHQSLKYEEVWMYEYADALQARHQIEAYRQHYAYDRPHQALDYGVPATRYVIRISGDPVPKVA